MRSSTNASLYNIAHCNLFVIRALVALFKREPNTRDRAIIESAARNFSTRHCSLRPIPPVRTEKLDSGVLVMKPANQGMRHDATDPLNRSRDRRIFVQ